MASFLAERYGDRLIVGILLVQAVKGVAVALWDPSSRSYLSNSVPEAERGKFIGCLAGGPPPHLLNAVKMGIP
jgi:MFS-type transporter involved in bile tolerance (Atg22 family)